MAAIGYVARMYAILTLITLINIAISEVLTPPYFNLAYQRQIDATSTCGQGVTSEERYCKLTGADPTNFETQYGTVIQGQLCDLCVNDDLANLYSRDRPKPDPTYWNWRVHKPEYAVDGSEKWWQSPPLSRGLQYNSVNLTVDLGQEFHVAYVFIKMANSPRPGVFALDRSTDGGLTYKPWQYFADTLNDCYHFFGKESPFTTSIVADDSIICTTDYSSIVPLENGEIAISLINDRPSAYNFVNAPVLQEWTKATNIRLRLIRTKTLLGHLMAVNVDQDPTVTRRYFYSIKDISIGGRCVCNGHADVCNKYDPTGVDPRKLVCSCQHNTCGDQCEYCCPGFVQKPWKAASFGNANECEQCQCHDHTTECLYDDDVARQNKSIDIHGNYEGGGVCQNCRHNTQGVNCERCVSGYFRPEGVPLNSRDVCQPCNCDIAFTTGDCEDGTGTCICRAEYSGPNCDLCNTGYYGWPRCQPCDCNSNGTLNGVCQARGGQCPCKFEYDGQYCDQCAYQYYDFPACKRCQCDGVGALDGSCNQYTGQCTCQNNYAGKDCDQCAPGYYNYPACNLCQCDHNGCTEEICDANNGFCLCKDNYSGVRCDQCARGYFNYPFCDTCNCQKPGSGDEYCDQNGQCNCNNNFAGPKCEKCAPGFFQYPNCLSCNCDTYGSYGKSCDQQTGACDCRPTFMGIACDQCRPNFYNYPNCEECNCNPAGAKDIAGYPLGGCGSVNNGILCECKDRVEGRVCDQCKNGFFNLDRNNPHGCENCDCYRPGTCGGQNHCDRNNGQCVCKTFTKGRGCNECMDGLYSLREYNHFGCMDCMCDVGGSLDGTCDKNSGECACRNRIHGRKCNEPVSTHYFPTLYHHQYEMEDGRTIRGGPVRYGYDNKLFPEFSWRGYAILSRVQDEVVIQVDVTRTTLFYIIYRFVNRNQDTVTAQVTVKSEIPGNEPQTATVYFPSTSGNPQLVNAGTTVYLTSGRWSVHLKSPMTLFVDYMVMLPREYYEASVLQQPINTPCRLPSGSNEPCKHYVYVDVSTNPTASGEQGTVRIGNAQERTQLFNDQRITDKLGSSGMAYLNSSQNEVSFSLSVLNPGRFYLVVLYHTAVEGRTQDLQVEVASQGVRENGQLRLAGCPYTSLCRQVVVDNSGDAKIFDIRGNYASILLTGKTDIDLAIDSVVAVPMDQWDLELIQPRLKCIQINQQCVESRYQNPTGAMQVQFESGPNINRVADDIPPNIIDTSVKVIKLSGSAPTVNVKASVDRPGPYAFVVHYFQPYDIGFDINVDVLIGPQINQGKFRADYCPGVSGCRSAVSFDSNSINGHTLDLSDLDLILAFNNSVGKPVWLDYVMVIPVPQSFPSDVLAVRPVDKSADFISQCGSDNFYIDPNTKGFCRDGVFSLTTDYNNGALNCECNIDGSLSFICKSFGGQCRCKPNVIGRDCSRCRTGYYGFPNCRACNCPSGLCDDLTGQCMCPPRVTGANCDTCLPETFGFDPLIGCEECNCHPDGIRRGNMACDVDSGQCECRSDIMGRRCDECHFGFYGFPSCRQCNCVIAGAEERICDPYNARCICKENVQEPNCDSCKPGTYYLEQRNTKGCTKCFCFGTTSQCQASNLRRKEVIEMLGWGMTNLHIPHLRTSGQTVETFVDQDNIKDPSMFHYWMAPLAYLQNKLTAYGGRLIYTVNFDIAQAPESDSLVKADVRLEGHNMTLTHISQHQPDPGTDLRIEVVLLEDNFVHEINGAPVTRQQFMHTLSQLDSLQIRASYYEKISYASLSEVILEVASTDGRGDLAENVEHCLCPPNYAGTSCERCASGYYRSKGGSYLGECIPCQCNGKSDVCDPETGECSGCRDSFTGPQCIKCMKGHYEDPYTGRCEACPCPGSGNNFAKTCQVSQSGIVVRCICEQGFTGDSCEICDNGYWGDPRRPGGRCELCNCNNNIDIRDRLSCDFTTGACLRCINNSTGDTCERCLDWYWGDAINRKDCQACKCDRIGSELCDPASGVCLCKPNVIGPECDRCSPGTFGFRSGRGCSTCDCADAAHSNVCDLETGACSCPPGVTGRRCDQCERGYFGYSHNGCQKCDCESDGAVTCDTVTGRCQCLPGVTGPKCDSCLPRWVLIPDQGCEECDQCVTLLLDDIEAMDFNISSIMDDLTKVNVDVGTLKRLKAINDSVNDLRPKIADIVFNPTDPASLDPLKKELMEVQYKATSVREKGHHTAREADVVQMDAKDVRIDADNLGELAEMAVDAANEAVTFAENILQDILSNIRDKNVDDLLAQAERILQEIQRRDFSDNKKLAEDELQKAIDALRRAKGVHNQAEEQMNRTMSLGKDVVDISDKLKDLMNNSRHSIDNSKAAIDINVRTRKHMTDLRRNLDEIKASASDAAMMESMANDLLEQARGFILDARAAFGEVEREATKLDTAMNRLKSVVDQLKADNLELTPLVQQAMNHALQLQKEAEKLDSLLADTRSSAEGALNASRAYDSIVDAIEKAMIAAEEAIKASEEAKNLSNGLGERARESRRVSEGYKNDAQDVKQTVETQLKPRLDRAVIETDRIEQLNSQNRDDLDELNAGLDMLPTGGYGQEAQDAASKAMQAQQTAIDAKDRIQAIKQQLPDDLDRVREIPMMIDEANRDIIKAQTQVDNVIGLVPQINGMVNKLNNQSQRIQAIGEDLSKQIKDLRDNIQLSRGEASRIEIGVQFKEDVALQVRNPDNIKDAGGYSKLSLYFRKDPTDANGFLAYVGPDIQSRQQYNDYMALEMKDGKVVFKYDLGEGAAKITSANTYNDGLWHEVIAVRTGKSGTLTIRTEDEPNDEIKGASPGTKSVLDLNPDSVKFFIGGVPVSAGLKDQLGAIRFNGAIEDVQFDGLPVGLWDFVYGENNIQGIEPRDVLTTAATNEFRFSGDGYIILDKGRFRPNRASRVEFMFKTYAENGLLFLMGQEEGFRDFFSIELKDGKILFQFDLGSGTAQLMSEETFNDGNWHRVDANRVEASGLLKVNSNTVESAKSRGTQTDLDIGDNIYIGGYKGTHMFPDVTNIPFEGCINEVKLGSSTRDLNDNQQALNVVPGCTEISRIVSFDGKQSFIAMPAVNINSDYQMTMKMKSTADSGLLFYVADDVEQKNAMSVVLTNGKIALIASADNVSTILETTIDTYNDGAWHYITVTKVGREIQLDIDDSEMVNIKYDSAVKKRIVTNTPLYFGGVPVGFVIKKENVNGIFNSLLGCIGDVTINGNFINFATAAPNDRWGVNPASCPIPDPTPPTTPRPSLPTYPPPRPTGETETDVGKCALPLRPAMVESDDAQGTRFGANPESRWQFDAVPAVIVDSYNFNMKFKTTSPDGVLFYVADDNHEDFMALYMEGGILHYDFNCGSGAARISSVLDYNDDVWHSVVFSRIDRSGTLFIDGSEEQKGESEGNSRSLNVKSPFYIGGLSIDVVTAAAKNLQNVTGGFVGCLKNPTLEDKSFGSPSVEVATQPCSGAVESGTFIGDGGGSVKLVENFEVKLDKEIYLEVRPRSLSGVLASVYSSRTGEYLVVQFVNGDVVFNVYNGVGEDLEGEELSTSFLPSPRNSLCDGRWHTIKAEKNKNVVRVAIDGVYSKVGVGVEGVSETNTNDPLYIGGVPTRHSGVRTTDDFVGCIRNVKIDGISHNLSGGMPEGSVNLNSCPTQ